MKKQKRILFYLVIGLLMVIVAVTAVYAQGNRLPNTPRTAVASNPAAAPPQQGDDPVPMQTLPDDSTFVELTLEAGFPLDPYLLRVVGQGETPAAEIDEACGGYINPDQPDVTLNWSGDSAALHIFVYSDGDPVLVVETPDGDFLCSDDADLISLDPLLTLEEPAEGSYHIHVGSYSPTRPVLGYLLFSEVPVADNFAALDLSQLLNRRDYPRAERLATAVTLNRLRLNESGIFGHADLTSDFDETSVTAGGGGDFNVAGLDGLSADCAGFVSLVPSYTFSWDGSGNLRILFEANRIDSTLGIVTPDGTVICNDNVAADNLNPAVTLSDTVEGDYKVYIGSHVPNEIALGQLTITSNQTAVPQPLAQE